MVKPALRTVASGFKESGSALAFTAFNTQRKQTFLALIQKLWPDVSKCCKLIGIHTGTFYNHMKSDVKFCNEIMAIKAAKLDELEGVSMKQGKIGKRGFLDRAMMLRAHRPEVFDRAKVVRVEGVRLGAGEARARLAEAEGAIDAEIVKAGLDRRSRKQLKQGRVQVEGSAGVGGTGGGVE